jgi:hypothetical protein
MKIVYRRAGQLFSSGEAAVLSAVFARLAKESISLKNSRSGDGSPFSAFEFFSEMGPLCNASFP